MMKKLAILGIAATVLATAVSLPRANAQVATPVNPQGVLKTEPFADVPPDHWAYSAVEFLRQSGLTEGYPDRTFKGKRPLTRYEFARFVQLLLQSVLPKLGAPGERGLPTDLVTRQELDQALGQLRGQMVTREEVQRIVSEATGRPVGDTSRFVTREQLQALQRLVEEFRDQLARLGVDVDAVKRDLADLRGRVEAIEAELARMPKIDGVANVIFKGAAKSDQTLIAPGIFRTVLDHDARPLTDDTSMLSPVLPYYDLDLGITARPASNVLVGAVLNVGNYLSSYDTNFHGYDQAGSDTVTPYKVYLSAPMNILGTSGITLGRQTTQLTPYTFKAIDPDTYTFIPREDSGEIVYWGASTNWAIGSIAKLKAFAGTRPLDARLLPVNLYPESIFGGVDRGLSTSFGQGSFGITEIGNFAGARLAFGEPAASVTPAETREVTVETAPPATATATPSPVPPTGELETSGYTIGPLRNITVGLNYLLAAGNRSHNVEDARAQVWGGDARLKLGPIRIEGEVAQGQSRTGSVTTPRPAALDDTAVDVRALLDVPLFGLGRLGLGGGWRRIELGYLVPGYWGTLGAWKNPRGIEGFTAQAELPLNWKIASFLSNINLTGSAEFYEGAENLATAGAITTNDPSEENLHIDRYQAAIAFRLTERNPVKLGFEQVFRNYVAERSGDLPLSLPTMGVGGIPLVGTRIKNTETYLNFGIGHNFTQDVSLALLYQIVDYAKYAVDNSNQPSNYRGYIASAQVGVRF